MYNTSHNGSTDLWVVQGHPHVMIIDIVIHMQAQFHAPSVQARASAGITMVLWHGLTETPLALDALDSA